MAVLLRATRRMIRLLVAAIGVLILLVVMVLAFLVPTARRSASSSEANGKALAILQNATSEATKAAAMDNACVLVRSILVDNHSIHGLKDPPPCPTTTTRP